MSERNDAVGDDTGAPESEAPETETGSRERGGLWLRLVFLLPVVLFLVMAGYFFWGLNPERDPRSVPAALVGKPVPSFELPPVEGLDLPTVTSEVIAETDGPILLNVFASWCAPCRIEHPIFMRLARERDDVAIYGINYKDAPADARRWLNNFGNPYGRVGAMSEARANVGIDLGVYGVPETYLIGPDGIIRYKYAGPITPPILNNEILPRLNEWAGK
jgi:cytochrome c biogenesis protein CcmG/thiol:disulfide interchange protein DsbE